jgi:signal transduction histidine kinase
MLHDFLTANRPVLIERCRAMAAGRSSPQATAHEFAHGIPVFLNQLIETLALEHPARPSGTLIPAGDFALSGTAALHGRDLFDEGLPIGQVVRDYGDVCQVVTNLAFETGAAISVGEFRTFNRCLDNAIAGAVSEYAKYTPESREDGAHILNARLGPLAHELRNYLQTATLVVSAIKAGNVGISGATAAILDRSLMGMRNLIDRSLAEVRLTAGLAPRPQNIQLAIFLSEVEASATLDARARDCRFSVGAVAEDVHVCGDPELLAAAVGNLLHNAFKFTKRHSEVWLRVIATEDRVFIEVEDRCGGLPEEACETLLRPFVQGGSDRSGLGLGLDICRRGVEATGGSLKIRNLPGSGCVFIIELPRLLRQ